MSRTHDSSTLAKQVSEILHMNQKENLKLYKELSQIPNGSVKDALDELSLALRAASGDTSGIVDFEKYYPKNYAEIMKKIEANKKTNTKDPYKANVIRENLAKMAADAYYLVRLKGDAGKAINLDEEVLKILQSYYEGGAIKETILTAQQEDEIYRKVWFGYVCTDIRSRLKETDEELTDDQIEYAAQRYVYEGDYDCNCSYWDNIDSVIEDARKDCN